MELRAIIDWNVQRNVRIERSKEIISLGCEHIYFCMGNSLLEPLQEWCGEYVVSQAVVAEDENSPKRGCWNLLVR